MNDGNPSYPFSASVTVAAAAFAPGGAQLPCRLWGCVLVNNTAALAYLQIFDKLLANVTLGTTAPDWVIPLAANQQIVIPPIGQLIARHKTAFTIAGTTGRANSTTAAIDVLLHLTS